MPENRKYNPQEITYVLSRVLAGWKHEAIAEAFKRDHSPYWDNKEFTKKQVSYIRNTYKIPPGQIQPYQEPAPQFENIAELSPLSRLLVMDAAQYNTGQQQPQHDEAVVSGPSGNDAHMSDYVGHQAGFNDMINHGLPITQRGDNQFASTSINLGRTVSGGNAANLYNNGQDFVYDYGPHGNLNVNNGSNYPNTTTTTTAATSTTFTDPIGEHLITNNDADADAYGDGAPDDDIARLTEEALDKIVTDAVNKEMYADSQLKMADEEFQQEQQQATDIHMAAASALEEGFSPSAVVHQTGERENDHHMHGAQVQQQQQQPVERASEREPVTMEMTNDGKFPCLPTQTTQSTVVVPAFTGGNHQISGPTDFYLGPHNTCVINGEHGHNATTGALVFRTEVKFHETLALMNKKEGNTTEYERGFADGVNQGLQDATQAFAADGGANVGNNGGGEGSSSSLAPSCEQMYPISHQANTTNKGGGSSSSAIIQVHSGDYNTMARDPNEDDEEEDPKTPTQSRYTRSVWQQKQESQQPQQHSGRGRPRNNREGYGPARTQADGDFNIVAQPQRIYRHGPSPQNNEEASNNNNNNGGGGGGGGGLASSSLSFPSFQGAATITTPAPTYAVPGSITNVLPGGDGQQRGGYLHRRNQQTTTSSNNNNNNNNNHNAVPFSGAITRKFAPAPTSVPGSSCYTGSGPGATSFSFTPGPSTRPARIPHTRPDQHTFGYGSGSRGGYSGPIGGITGPVPPISVPVPVVIRGEAGLVQQQQQYEALQPGIYGESLMQQQYRQPMRVGPQNSYNPQMMGTASRQQHHYPQNAAHGGQGARRPGSSSNWNSVNPDGSPAYYGSDEVVQHNNN